MSFVVAHNEAGVIEQAPHSILTQEGLRHKVIATVDADVVLPPGLKARVVAHTTNATGSNAAYYFGGRLAGVWVLLADAAWRGRPQ